MHARTHTRAGTHMHALILTCMHSCTLRSDALNIDGELVVWAIGLIPPGMLVVCIFSVLGRLCCVEQCLSRRCVALSSFQFLVAVMASFLVLVLGVLLTYVFLNTLCSISCMLAMGALLTHYNTLLPLCLALFVSGTVPPAPSLQASRQLCSSSKCIICPSRIHAGGNWSSFSSSYPCFSLQSFQFSCGAR